MRILILFALCLTLLVAVNAARLPREANEKAVEKTATDLLNGGEAETRSKITDFTKQVSGTFSKYFSDGKQSLSSLVDKAENQLRSIRKASSEQLSKAKQSVSKAVDTVRQSITGSLKKIDAPKIENPISDQATRYPPNHKFNFVNFSS